MEGLKILVPTDFSAQAEFAYRMVKKLQERMTVSLHFLHVLAMPDTVTMDPNGNIKTCGEIDVKYVVNQKQIAEQKLLHLKTLYGTDINTHLVLGKITDAILNFSVAHQFDLIVMGTKGAWGLKERLSGSETQMIARKSAIPLLSLMCDRSALTINHLLLVHNFSNPVQEDLILVQKLLKAFDATLHLLQITSVNADKDQPSVEADMKKFASINNITHYQCHLMNDMDVENGVVHFNQMMNMDMICIGTYGKGGIFHQSAAEKLINHLYKPIISFQLNK